MKTKIILCWLLLLQSLCVWSQYVIKTASELEELKKLPLEKAYVSHTGPIVLTGEYLYYSFYCFNAQTNKRSNISKVGYLALVNEERAYVLEQKIKLEKGLGQGDFFIPVDLPSGNYQLLGYTQWMKNGGLPQVFKTNLAIINPYRTDQSALLPNKNNPKALTKKTIQATIDTATIGLLLDKERFSKREKVSFALKNYKGNLGHGTYTIKVLHKDFSPQEPTANAISFAKTYFNVPKQLNLSVGDSLQLPEQRGELFSGKVLDPLSGNPLPNTRVVVSLPGKEFVLKYSTTDKEGNFYTYLKKDYKTPTAIVQLTNPKVNAAIMVNKPSKLALKDLQFDAFKLKPEHQEIILKRSIQNQIENQFFDLKPDSLLLGSPIDPFDGGVPEVFVLDDYTRFPSFKETLVEILNNAGYRNNPKGNDYIRIAQDFETFNEDYNDFPAIVLFDGVYITNHEAMKDFDARTIKSISLIRDQFQLANKTYQGIMAVETFGGDFYAKFKANNGVQVRMVKPLNKKNYFIQTHTTATNSNRIPDYRRVLLWQPNLTLDSNQIELEFYTSDLTGNFNIVLDGFTSYGKPIHFSKEISVH